tara:strand:- start:246 stop:443 length:198 start_codon:yes stop_codon:yes gene_type:complete
VTKSVQHKQGEKGGLQKCRAARKTRITKKTKAKRKGKKKKSFEVEREFFSVLERIFNQQLSTMNG